MRRDVKILNVNWCWKEYVQSAVATSLFYTDGVVFPHTDAVGGLGSESWLCISQSSVDKVTGAVAAAAAAGSSTLNEI